MKILYYENLELYGILKKTTITPRRKKAIVLLSTGRYKSATNSIVTFSKTHVYVLSVVTKQINKEMKTISSLNYKFSLTK